MLRVRSLAWTVCAAVALAVAIPPAVADAAPLPVHLGQTATKLSAEASERGGCECTAAQFSDVGPITSTYAFPYDGVIVASGFYIGSNVEAVEAPTVQVETAHQTGAAAGTVISQGTVHDLLGLPTNAVDSFYERVPARAGDVLAARFHNSPFLQSTPVYFKTATSGDTTAVSGPTAAGGSLTISPGAVVSQRRLNLEAVLEPDEDGDGYGDASQDLCPGSPIATSACSGTLIGSDLQGPHARIGPCGSGGCMRVQTTVAGVSTAAPFNGVVVRWRVLNADTGSYRARVVSFNPGSSGGMYRAYDIRRSSAAQSVTAPAGPLFSKISSFPTRLPIAVGEYVALSGGVTGEGFQASTGEATYSATNEVGDGLTATGETHDGTVMYDADIEPDVDGDGYGDVSQDRCPASASIHEAPCPAPPPTEGGRGEAGSGAPVVPPGIKRPAPTISSLSLKPKSFLAKPLGPVAARGKSGTKVRLTLSAKATVTMAIEMKHGRRFRTVTKLTKSLPPGKRTIVFSGQYRRGGDLVDLAAGAYRLSATAKSAAGVGPVARTTFTVLPPA